MDASLIAVFVFVNVMQARLLIWRVRNRRQRRLDRAARHAELLQLIDQLGPKRDAVARKE